MIKNRQYKQYTPAQKAKYFAQKAKSYQRARVSGNGSYSLRPPGRNYVRGRGKYNIPKDFFNARQVGGGLGSAVGGLIGSMIAPGSGTAIGTSLGNQIGSALGSGFKAITGWGDYTVSDNSLLFPDRAVPSFGEDTIRVKKKEYICDIDGTSAFSNNFFAVNPGLNDTFPWLSSIANNYEQYRFNGLQPISK